MDDEERRGFMQLLTGKDSAAKLTHREATLVLDRLYAMKRCEAPPTWRTDGATSGELAKAAELREALGAPRFDGLARRITRGQTILSKMSGRQVRAIIEATKSILARENATAQRETRGN